MKSKPVLSYRISSPTAVIRFAVGFKENLEFDKLAGSGWYHVLGVDWPWSLLVTRVPSSAFTAVQRCIITIMVATMMTLWVRRGSSYCLPNLEGGKAWQLTWEVQANTHSLTSFQQSWLLANVCLSTQRKTTVCKGGQKWPIQYQPRQPPYSFHSLDEPPHLPLPEVTSQAKSFLMHKCIYSS